MTETAQRTWPVLSMAVESGATQSLGALLRNLPDLPEAGTARALEQAAAEQEWGAVRLLWPRVVAPFTALQSSRARTMLIRAAPTTLWFWLCQQRPPAKWATPCLHTMVSQHALRDRVVDVVERLVPFARGVPQDSWALIARQDDLVRALWPTSEPMTAAAALVQQGRFEAIDRMTPWLTDDQQDRLCWDHAERLPQMHERVLKRTQALARADQAHAAAPHRTDRTRRRT